MKRAKIIIIAILFISISAGLPFTESVKGNSYVFSLMPKEHMLSPLNQTYNINSVTAEATIELSPKIYEWSDDNEMHFLLDRNSSSFMNNPNYRVFSVDAVYEGKTSDGWFIFRGKTVISNLSDGEHLLEITFSPAGLGTIDQYKSKAVFRVETQNPVAQELSVIVLLPVLLSTIVIVYRRHRKHAKN